MISGIEEKATRLQKQSDPQAVWIPTRQCVHMCVYLLFLEVGGRKCIIELFGGKSRFCSIMNQATLNSTALPPMDIEVILSDTEFKGITIIVSLSQSTLTEHDS